VLHDITDKAYKYYPTPPMTTDLLNLIKDITTVPNKTPNEA